MDRLAYRDDTGRARLTRYGMQMYCSTQATADCFAKLEESIPRWIHVKERLPEEEGYYLTIGPYGAIRVCYYGSSLKHRGYQVFLDQNKKKINAIAWMIIPRYKIKEEK